VVRRELAQHEGYQDLPIEIVHASERVTMEESAGRAFKSKREQLAARGLAAGFADGAAQGFVSAGNTGAVMATAKIVQGVVPGVDRPALAGIFPSVEGSPVVVLDVGANVDCSPRMLAQFAVNGARCIRASFYGRPKPRVGLLSIGEEEHKGDHLTHAAMPLLKALNLNFIGKRGKAGDIYGGKVGRDRVRRVRPATWR